MVPLGQACQLSRRGILERCAELFRCADQGTLVTGRVRPCEEKLGLGVRFSIPLLSGFPNAMSNSAPTDWIVPERPPLEIASAVNMVFIVGRRYRRIRRLPTGCNPTATPVPAPMARFSRAPHTGRQQESEGQKNIARFRSASAGTSATRF